MQRIHESSYHPDRYVERVKYFGELEVAQVVTATQRDTLLTNPYQSRLRDREVYTTIQQRQRDHIKVLLYTTICKTKTSYKRLHQVR